MENKILNGCCHKCSKKISHKEDKIVINYKKFSKDKERYVSTILRQYHQFCWSIGGKRDGN